MRTPTVSNVLHCGKNELKYIKMHKALAFFHYCLERYDCFSIYKIESGQFKFFRILHANTAIAYVGGHFTSFFYTQSSIQYCMEENSSSVEVLGEKNQIGTYRFEIHYLGEGNQWMKGLLAGSFHPWHPPTSPSGPTGFRRLAMQRTTGSILVPLAEL